MRRRIFVGDVQGCADELEELVARARSRFGDDFELWVAGDVVNRGPDNRRALELVRGFVDGGRGRYVLGNHEIHLLCVAFGLRELGRFDSIGDVLGAPDAQEWIDWLRGRALVEPGVVDGQRFALIHAAPHPDWSLETLCDTGRAIRARLAGPRDGARAFLAASPESDPLRDALGRLTRCRSVTVEGERVIGWSSADPDADSLAWHEVWGKRRHDYALVYGHWARQGLHVTDRLRGLDTGCVHHGRGRDGFLTAWLPDEGRTLGGSRPFDAPDDRFWRIPARRAYYRVAEGERD